MTELYTVTDYEVTVNQLQHPEMNYAEFTQHADQELRKFIQMIANMQCDFIAPQDVSAVGGLNCRFHHINAYPAVRQITQYNPSSKTWIVWFDCRVLTRAPQQVQLDGSAAAKLEPLDSGSTPGDTAPEEPAEKVLH